MIGKLLGHPLVKGSGNAGTGAAMSRAGADGMSLRDERAATERLAALGDRLSGREPAHPLRSRAVSNRERLTGSSFSLTGGTAGGGYLSVWGRGAHTAFDGRDGELDVDGDVTTGMLGADWAAGRLTAGLAVGHSMGEGGYRGGGDAGEVESALTGVYPYLGYDLPSGSRCGGWRAMARARSR